MPAPTPQAAQDKWERKTSGAGDKWKANTQDGDYAGGVADFWGMSPGEVGASSAWSEGVDATSAGDFDSAVQGKGDKWRRNTERGLRQG